MSTREAAETPYSFAKVIRREEAVNGRIRLIESDSRDCERRFGTHLQVTSLHSSPGRQTD